MAAPLAAAPRERCEERPLERVDADLRGDHQHTADRLAALHDAGGRLRPEVRERRGARDRRLPGDERLLVRGRARSRLALGGRRLADVRRRGLVVVLPLNDTDGRVDEGYGPARPGGFGAQASARCGCSVRARFAASTL